MASRDLSPTALRLTQELAPIPPPGSRSFAGLPVKIDPITTSRPTNADLAKGFNQIHACLEDHKDATAKEFREIKQAWGLDHGQKPVAGLSTPRKAFLRTVFATITAAVALGAAYRFAVTIWPYAWGALKAINTAILAGKI